MTEQAGTERVQLTKDTEYLSYIITKFKPVNIEEMLPSRRELIFSF
jgi:hypothetical protein